MAGFSWWPSRLVSLWNPFPCCLSRARGDVNFSFSPSHRNSITNDPCGSGFYKWWYFLRHSSASPQVGGSTKSVQWLKSVTQDYVLPTVVFKTRVFLSLIVNVFFFSFFFFNPGEKSFLESLSRLLLRFPSPDGAHTPPATHRGNGQRLRRDDPGTFPWAGTSVTKVLSPLPASPCLEAVTEEGLMCAAICVGALLPSTVVSHQFRAVI